MIRHLGPWASRAALICVGIVAALAMLEGLLRLGGVLYELRPGARSGVQLANSDSYRVLCLGESTTAGLAWGDRAYPNQLERILNERAGGRAKFAVINGGKVATTTDVIVARLPAMLDEIDPDVVVTMMGVNDGKAVDPSFQVGGALRVWKLMRMLYNQYRPPTEAADDVDDLLMRARATMKYWPDVAIGLAERIIQLEPADVRGYLVLAEARFAQKKAGLAAEAYLKALELDGPAVLAYAFTADEKLSDFLDGVFARAETSSYALAARSVLGLRRLKLADADHYARRAIEIDPHNAIALVVHGRVLQLRGADMEARVAFYAAAEVNPRVVELLEGRGLFRSAALTEIVSGEDFVDLLAKAGPVTSDERWLRAADEEVRERFRGLQLVKSWEQIANGENREAEEYLRQLADPEAQVEPSERLRAYGQLAILAWQRGDAAEAERYHDLVEEALADGSTRTPGRTTRPWRRFSKNAGSHWSPCSTRCDGWTRCVRCSRRRLMSCSSATSESSRMRFWAGRIPKSLPICSLVTSDTRTSRATTFSPAMSPRRS